MRNKIIFSSALGIQVRDTEGTIGPSVVRRHTCSSLTIHALCGPALKCPSVFVHFGLSHYLKGKAVHYRPGVAQRVPGS